jgi:hypothetical protein
MWPFIANHFLEQLIKFISAMILEKIRRSRLPDRWQSLPIHCAMRRLD